MIPRGRGDAGGTRLPDEESGHCSSLAGDVCPWGVLGGPCGHSLEATMAQQYLAAPCSPHGRWSRWVPLVEGLCLQYLDWLLPVAFPASGFWKLRTGT